MKFPGSNFQLTGVVLGIAVLPALARAFGAISLAPGVFVVSMLLIMLLISRLLGSSLMINKKLLVALFAGLAFVLVHGAMSSIFHNQFDYSRFIQSYFLLILYLCGAFSFYILINSNSESKVDFAVRLTFYVLAISGVLAIFKINPFFSTHIPVVFFAENSHYALQLSPFLLYVFVTTGYSKKYYWVAFAFLLAILLKSMTLSIVVFVILISMTRLKVKLLLTFTLVSLFFLFAGEATTSYFSGRMNISIESDNLSVLALLQGNERAILNLMETYGMGVGFQQFGIVGSRGELIDLMNSFGANDWNLLDGATVGAKLVGEFGVFGLILIGVYLKFFVKKIHRLRQVANGMVEERRAEIFFDCCYVTFIVEIFLRGTAYFSSTGLMLCASLFMFIRAGKLYPNHRRSIAIP